jgi:hypothetical protein
MENLCEVSNCSKVREKKDAYLHDTATMTSENQLALAPFVATALVHGDGCDTFCIVFAVADVLVEKDSTVQSGGDQSRSNSENDVACGTVNARSLHWRPYPLLSRAEIQLAYKLVAVQVP